MTMSCRTLGGLSTGQALEHGSRWQLGMMAWLRNFNRSQTPRRRRWLERHANRLVERYFGLAPEASAADHKGLRFSRRAFVAAIGVLECLTQATLTRFLYELGPDFPGLAGDESISKSKRLSKLIGVYDQRPERTVEGGDTLQDVIIEKAAALVRVDLLSWGDDAPEWVSDHKEFCRLLAMDGFVVTDGSLRRSLPEDVNLPAAQNELDRLLAKHSFVVPAGHLRQAVEAHADGHWASATVRFEPFLTPFSTKLPRA
jgi:hypothetical protein